MGGHLFQIKRCDAVHNCLSGKYVQLNNMADTHKVMYDGKTSLKNYLEAQIFAEKENGNERFCL